MRQRPQNRRALRVTAAPALSAAPRRVRMIRASPCGGVLVLAAVLTLLGAAPARAQGFRLDRHPVGVYAHLYVQDAINAYPGKGKPSPWQLHAYLRNLYAGLLADHAIAGITAGVHWDTIQLADPLCILSRSCPAGTVDGYDWSYVDDVFAEAEAAGKTVQLIVTPGVDAPPWLFAKIPSCDGLFDGTGARRDCGWATFEGFPESQRADSQQQPLPWNPVYVAAWDDFLVHLSERYGANPAFVAVAVGGPMCASTEFILPTKANGSTQLSGLDADSAWAMLINHSFPLVPRYQNTDEAFVDAWDRTIDAYERIFYGITIVISPDAGNDWPELPGPVHTPTNQWLYTTECSANASNPMSCAAKTEVIEYFLDVLGPNRKSTEVGGMTAGSRVKTGDIGIASIKLLTGLTPPPLPPILGGAQFDHSVYAPDTFYQQGCPDYTANNPMPADCLNPPLTPEEGAYNTLAVFFSGTPVAQDFGAAPGPAPVQYVELDYTDVIYAETHPDPRLPSTIPGAPSLHDLLLRASRDLFGMAW